MKRIYFKIKEKLVHMFSNKVYETMTELEIALLKKQLNICSSFLEFGAGASTVMAIKIDSIKQVVSVESDAIFWAKLQEENSEMSDAIKSKRLHPLLVNIGVLRGWGYPMGTELKENWPSYSLDPFVKFPNSHELILVDGRFRICCVLNACLHGSTETRILIHDFFNRPQLFVVLPFLNLIERADTLGLFSINQESDKSLIKKYIEIYRDYPE